MKKTYSDILDESIGIFKEELVRVDRRKVPFGRRYADRPFDPKLDDPVLKAARWFDQYNAPNRRKGDVTRRAKEQSPVEQKPEQNDEE